MSGTSMDGVDLSLIKTNGEDKTHIIFEKNYTYSEVYKKKLKDIIRNLPNYKSNQMIYAKNNEGFITNKFLHYLRLFMKNPKIALYKIDLIGLSGQTIFHNPDKKYSIQLGSGKSIYKEMKIPVITNFRQKDLMKGGQGAPIGSFYHKSILEKINKNGCIINLGGIANITYIGHNKKLISYDLGPANALIDDLSKYFYKKNFDKDGKIAAKGKLIKSILKKFRDDIYFKKKYPKSLDRNYFKKNFQELIMNKSKDAIHTASMMTVDCLITTLNTLKKIELVILSGGGRKNLFLKENIKKKLRYKKMRIIDIDDYGYNGDLLEAQMFGYLAVRSLKKLIISTPSTTGINESSTGGVKYGSLIKN